MYELYRGTKFQRLVLLQFLSRINLFFGGYIQNSTDVTIELYQNLTFETLRGRRQQFEKISDLPSHINLKLQESIISNLNDKNKAAGKSNEKIEEKYSFLEQKDTHGKSEEHIANDILNIVLYNYKKTDEPYIEPTVDDALKIENEIRNDNDNFLDSAMDFNEIDIFAANQKQQVNRGNICIVQPIVEIKEKRIR